ncbi:MAG: response regulator [Verrucomicrobia bacterium]|nr:response regulator [Verrucomicrobiota bacterium]
MAKKRILIVDDEEYYTRLLKKSLELSGVFEVRAENDSTHALTAAREFRPDLILLDIMMPGMDGGDVAGAILGDPLLKTTPIVFVTAAVRKNESGLIGGIPFLAKPVALEEFVSCINTHLKGSTCGDVNPSSVALP